MHVLFVVDRAADWPLKVPGSEVVAARDYLAGFLSPDAVALPRRAVVVNLCRSYAYQRAGYYVSLLASARGHRAMPDIDALLELRSQQAARLVSTELQKTIDRALKGLKSDTFRLSIYFGRPLAKRYANLARALDGMFRAPLLRARFERDGDRENAPWRLVHVAPIPAKEVPEQHHGFVVEAAVAWLGRSRPTRRAAVRGRIAMLVDPDEPTPPSNPQALKRFEQVARKHDLRVEMLGRHDLGRLAGFDALFLRATTAVGHYTYRFARRAEAEGLAVIDDPRSIVRCSNKVYLAELADRLGVPVPMTRVVHQGNREAVAAEMGLPIVLKAPDGSFSRGVVRCDDADALNRELDRLLESSDMVVAQEYMPTEFDWRVGVFNGQPLFVCRYHMARDHWQILHRTANGKTEFGKVDAIPVAAAPAKVLKIAVQAADAIGDGLYGVDLKQSGKRVVLIEVNDNPNIDCGVEDRVLADELYRRILEGLIERAERRRHGRA